jgi:hypothetical protein
MTLFTLPTPPCSLVAVRCLPSPPRLPAGWRFSQRIARRTLLRREKGPAGRKRAAACGEKGGTVEEWRPGIHAPIEEGRKVADASNAPIEEGRNVVATSSTTVEE